MNAPTQTDDGWCLWLPCPRCGNWCHEMPPYPPQHPGHHPWWQEGDEGTCACGARLEVRVDDGIASLHDLEEDE